MPCFSRVANGNIAPSRFVTPVSGTDGRVTQSGSGETPIGISQPGTRNTPYSSLDDGYCAIAGENVGVFGQGDNKVPLELGGTVTNGQFIKPDSSGKGVVASSADDIYGARAEANGVSGEVIPVTVMIGYKSA